MRIDTPPFKQRTVYAHDVSHSEGVCVQLYGQPSLSGTYCVRMAYLTGRWGVCVACRRGQRVGDALARYRGVAAVQVGR